MEQEARAYGPFFKKVLPDAVKDADSKIKGCSNPQVNPKQGHHIINKDVLNIYEDIIRGFVRDNNSIFEGNSYDNLKEMKMIIDDGEEEASDFLVVNNPLSTDLKGFIESTRVDVELHFSTNDLVFSRAKSILIFCVKALMLKMYEKGSEEKGDSLVSLFENDLVDLRRIIAEKFFPSSGQCAYVDHVAFNHWEENEKDKYKVKVTKFNNCKIAIKEMLENIACKKTEDSKTPLVFNWVKGIFSIKKALSSA